MTKDVIARMGLDAAVRAARTQTAGAYQVDADGNVLETFRADDQGGDGYIADIEFKRRQLGVLEQKQNLDALNQQLAARRNLLTDSQYSLEQLPTVMAGKIQTLRGELASAEQRMAEINGRRAYVLRAPAAGRVSTMQATVGQFADPRRLQMEIVPSDSVLEDLDTPADYERLLARRGAS